MDNDVVTSVLEAMPQDDAAAQTPSKKSDAAHWTLPRKSFIERKCNESIRNAYLKAGLSTAVADFLGRRLERFLSWDSLIAPRLSDIADPALIPSMDQAVDRIARAILSKERIVLTCDHDMDGTASAAVLWTAMVDCFNVAADRLCVVTSHRLTEGHGIGEGVVQRIEQFHPQLVISADKGSSDEPRIATLASHGIDVVVTDHHIIPPEGPPRSAYAVVNPSRLDSDYDKNICGAGVAFLVMAKVRSALLESGSFPQLPSLAGLLDFVAVATIADCVSLSPAISFTNRAFLRRGLALLRSGCRPCWRIFSLDVRGELDAETLAFRLVPAVAAAGRLDWAEAGFRFLISKTEAEAATYWAELKHENAERQAIERRLRGAVFPQAAQIEGPAIVLFLEDGHCGVHGITASRVVEAFGKPCAIFAPRGKGARREAQFQSRDNDGNLASGSFRSVPGIDVQRALQAVAHAHPDLLITYGGHQAAAGATIRIRDVEQFRQAFSLAIREQTGGIAARPTIWTDGELDGASHTLESVRALHVLDPFGRGFEAPIYSGRFRVALFRPLMGGRHGRLQLERGDLRLEAIWFSLDTVLPRSPAVGDRVEIAYRLARHEFRGEVQLQATIVAGTFH